MKAPPFPPDDRLMVVAALAARQAGGRGTPGGTAEASPRVKAARRRWWVWTSMVAGHYLVAKMCLGLQGAKYRQA